MLKRSAATSDASVWEILRRMSLHPNGARLTGVAGLRPARLCGPLTTWCIDKRHRLIDLPASTRQLAQSRQHGPQMAIVHPGLPSTKAPAIDSFAPPGD